MVLESRGQFPVGRLLDHVRQRFHDLIFGVVDVLQDVQEKVIHRFDVFGKQTHDALPNFIRNGVVRDAAKSRG
jgi:hypothetical protein